MAASDGDKQPLRAKLDRTTVMGIDHYEEEIPWAQACHLYSIFGFGATALLACGLYVQQLLVEKHVHDDKKSMYHKEVSKWWMLVPLMIFGFVTLLYYVLWMWMWRTPPKRRSQLDFLHQSEDFLPDSSENEP